MSPCMYLSQFRAVSKTRVCATSQGEETSCNQANGVCLLHDVVGMFTKRASLHSYRGPGKDLDKQRVVEHDQLIHEFERLTSDPDGLLGVLEDTLDEYGGDATFEAKKLLCALFQVATY